MIRRIAALSILLLAAPTAAAQNGALYVPGAHRYEVTNVVQREQENLGVKQTFEFRTVQQVSLQLSRHGRDTLAFTVTLDSSSSSTPDGAELPDLNGLKGIGIRGAMSALGRVYEYRPVADLNEETARELQMGMSRLLPVFPQGVGVGTTWTDTNVTAVTNEGSDLRTTTIVTSTVLADTTYDGQPALRVQRRVTQSMSGTGAQLGQTMKMEGSGTGEGISYVSRAGVYLAATDRVTSRMTLTLAPSGLTIPVTQTLTSSVRRLPPPAPR